MEIREEMSVALKELEDFVGCEQARAGGAKADFNGRDTNFLLKAKQAINSEKVQDLRNLLEEMKGLSHYFCAYSKDTKSLDALLDNLFASIQKALQ